MIASVAVQVATIQAPEHRIDRITGRDGKIYPRRSDPQLPARIRTLRKAGATIREIAAELGCSVGTAHRYAAKPGPTQR
ncbi:MAG TPA: hypothetical protein VN255_01170 [Mycobacterium sp.]|nr:hypothetical protein [Mycobacterium sp.]HWT47238.1 hypothetical protein [Mycobacterium sp.]